MGAVTIQNVRKSFGTVEVLHGIDVDIQEGEFTVLVGPSGCGKSTLLRLIAGLEDITSGDILIGGEVVTGQEPSERDIAMVFQTYALYPHMTVEQNMGFALKLARIEKSEVRARVLKAADMLGLTEYLDRRPRALSGGQRQRVAMGRAIVRDPKVFLFDEPLSNLDAKLRVQMRAEIRANHRRLGTTTVYVTHDQIEAMTMADRIVVMNDGYVEQIGTPLELYDRPGNRFVAGFIGSPAMNMLRGQLVGGDFSAEDGTKIALGIATAGGEREVDLGVRAEHFALDETGVAAEVVSLEHTGAETLVVMRLAGQDVTGSFRERIDVEPGGTVKIGFNPERLHLFDAATGARLPDNMTT